MPRVPRPDELPRASLEPANEPPTINPNVAGRIGQAGRSMGNAIEAIGGAFGEVVGRIGQAQDADNYARAKLETLKGYDAADDDIGKNVGEDGQLWTTAPDRYKAVHEDIDKRYPISNPNRKREFDTWRESQAYTRGKRAALTYQDAQRSQFVRGYDADLQGFEDRVSRGEVDPETFNQTHDALRERLYGLNRTVMGQAEVEQRARQLQGRLAGAVDRYLATKDPAERERFWDQVRKGRYELDDQVQGRGSGPTPRAEAAPSRAAPVADVQDFSRGRGYGTLPASSVKHIVLHDVSGPDRKSGRVPKGGSIGAYHITFDKDGIYQEVPFDRRAPHATTFNDKSIAIAHIGYEGDKLSPEAVANGAKAVKMVAERFGISPENILRHPELGAAGTRRGSKDPKEASWREDVLSYLKANPDLKPQPVAEAKPEDPKLVSGPTEVSRGEEAPDIRSRAITAGMPKPTKVSDTSEAPASDGAGNDEPAPASYADKLSNADPEAKLGEVLSAEELQALKNQGLENPEALTVSQARNVIEAEPKSGTVIPPGRTDAAPRTPGAIPTGRLVAGQVFEVRTPKGTIRVPSEWLNELPAETRAQRSRQAAEAYRVFERERQAAADKSMKDGEAHIGAFGTLPPGYDAEAIKQAYGRDPKKIADHVRRMRLAKGTHDALADAANLPDDEVLARLEALRPNEGEPDAAERTAIVAQAEKRITAMLTKREKDPGGAVEQSREVKAIREKLVGGAPRNVHDRGALADARLQAQARIEIPEAVRSPISVDEARALGAGLRASNIGTATAEIEKLYKRAEGEWGKRHAEGIVRSVIRTQIRDQKRRETYDAMLTGFIEDQDRPPPPPAAAPGPTLMERAWQMVPSRKSVGDFFGGMDLGVGDALPPDAAARGPATNPEAAPEQVYPKPSNAHIRHLKSNPALVDQFDAKFGAGAAEKAIPGIRRSLLLQGAQ